MKVIQLIAGAVAAKGKSKGSGREYEYGQLHHLVPFMTWENENGRAVASGFCTPQKGDTKHQPVECTMDMLELVKKLPLPAFLELEMAPSEDDFTKLVCVGITVKQSIPVKFAEFQSLYRSVSVSEQAKGA